MLEEEIIKHQREMINTLEDVILKLIQALRNKSGTIESQRMNDDGVRHIVA